MFPPQMAGIPVEQNIQALFFCENLSIYSNLIYASESTSFENKWKVHKIQFSHIFWLIFGIPREYVFEYLIHFCG